MVESPELQRRFRHYANSEEPDETLRFVAERGQRRPADWERALAAPPAAHELAIRSRRNQLGAAGGGQRGAARRRHRGALRRRPARAVPLPRANGRWYAAENRCPHTGDMVLGRGIVGDQDGRAKVACPQHKKTFDLETGAGLSDPEFCVATFETRVDEGKVYVQLPPAARLARRLAAGRGASGCDKEE